MSTTLLTTILYYDKIYKFNYYAIIEFIINKTAVVIEQNPLLNWIGEIEN